MNNYTDDDAIIESIEKARHIPKIPPFWVIATIVFTVGFTLVVLLHKVIFN